MRSCRRPLKRFIASDLLEGPFVGDPLQDGRLDSLAIEQLVAFIEETYGLEIDDESLVASNFGSLDAVTRYVDDRRREAKGQKRRKSAN